MPRLRRLEGIAWLGIALYTTAFAIAKLRHYGSIYDLSFLFGATARSLVERATLVTPIAPAKLRLEGVGVEPILFGAHRRPLIPVFLATMAVLWDSVLVAGMVKLFLGGALICSAGRPFLEGLDSLGRRLALAAALYACLLPSFMSQLVGLDIEEGYLIPMLTFLTCGVLRAPPMRGAYAVLAPLVNAGLILTKSSMLGVGLVVMVAHVVGGRTRRVRVAFVGAVGAALVVIVVLNAAFSGRVTLASSIDWFNVFKGNNELTARYYWRSELDHLPVVVPSTLRREWELADHFRARVLAFVWDAPETVAALTALRAWNFFVRIDFAPSTRITPIDTALFRAVWLGSNLTWRLILLAALLIAACDILGRGLPGLRPRRAARPMGVFLWALIGAYALPYLVGFAYLRHVMVLVLPVLAYLVWRLADGESSS